MIKRTITGAVVAVLIYAWVFFSHITPILYAGTLILTILAVLEIFRLCKTDKPHIIYLSFGIAVLLLILPISSYESLMILILPVVMLVFTSMMIMLEKTDYLSGNNAICVAISVMLLFKSIPYLRDLDNGFYYLIFAVTASFITDVFAYIFGKAFGTKRLCPKISPNKTIEGAMGGIVCTMLVTMIAALLLQKHTDLRFDGITLAIWSLLTSVIGQFGDLCMSVVKRIAGVKDFGNLLPGHGGILDRFDSHMMAIAFTLAFCTLTGGFIY